MCSQFDSYWQQWEIHDLRLEKHWSSDVISADEHSAKLTRSEETSLFFFFLTQEQSYNYSSTSNARLFMRWQSVKFVFSSCINKDGTLTVNDNSVSQNEKIHLLLKQVFMGWDFD